MGIAGVKPCQLAPTVGMMGSGSTDSPAPSPIIDNLTASTRLGDLASAMAIDSASLLDIDPAIDTATVIAVLAVVDTNDKIDIDFAIDAAAIIDVPAVVDTNDKIDIDSTIDITAIIVVPAIVDTNDKIDIDFTIDIAISIAVPSVISTTSLEPEVDIAGSTITGTALPSDTGLILAAIIVDPTSGTMGAVSATTGGFDMAFGLFNFHVDNNEITELISVSDPMRPAMAPSTLPVTEGNPSVTAPPTPLEEKQRPKDSTPSVGSNDFEAPPPSPTPAYCTDCNAYQFVGAGDFSSHEIAGCEDPRGGTAAVYLTISECERALNALTLRTTPYDPDYVEGLYSDYTCSDDDVYPEAKGKIGNSDSSYSSKSVTSSNEYMVDYDSDLMIEVESYLRDDDTYPPALGEISDNSTPPFEGHCMMASHGDGNENRANDGRNRSNTGRQFITQEQIRYTRRVYAGEADMGPNPSPQELAVLRVIIQEQKDQISTDRRILERRRDEADASSRRQAALSSHYSSSVQHRT
jgi:hypothetical protein